MSLKSFHNDTQVGFIIYSKKSKLLFGFDYHTEPSSLFCAVDSVRYLPKQIGKAENIGAALEKAQNLQFGGSRPNVQRAFALITGSPANSNIITPLRRLRQASVRIFGMGIGNEEDRLQLQAILIKPAS